MIRSKKLKFTSSAVLAGTTLAKGFSVSQKAVLVSADGPNLGTSMMQGKGLGYIIVGGLVLAVVYLIGWLLYFAARGVAGAYRLLRNLVARLRQNREGSNTVDSDSSGNNVKNTTEDNMVENDTDTETKDDLINILKKHLVGNDTKTKTKTKDNLSDILEKYTAENFFNSSSDTITNG